MTENTSFFFLFVTHTFVDQKFKPVSQAIFLFHRTSPVEQVRLVIPWYSAASAGKTVSGDRKPKVSTGMN